MKLIAKARNFPLLIMLLLAGLSVVSFSERSSAAKIGDNYGGGVVFFVNGQHGLIAAKADIPGHSPDKPNGLFGWNDANTACNNLVSEGFSDWFLPSKNDLKQLFFKKRVVGGFADYYYWSSTECGADSASFQYFANGARYVHTKRDGARVRAVRSF